MRRIEIDPVTRIEGHARISLHLNQEGQVSQARLHVEQFRGFEKIAVGRPFYEMPGLMARTCGICPVSHLVAAAKAGDALLAVEVPAAGERLRRILHLAQLLQSHALSFFYLSAPDLLLGFDHDPAQRNVLGLYAANPQAVREGVALRAFGQEIIARLAGKRIHPAWVVPGGVSSPMNPETQSFVLAGLPSAFHTVRQTLDLFKTSLDKWSGEIAAFANFPSLYLGLVDAGDNLEMYDGWLRLVNDKGQEVGRWHPSQYAQAIAEADEPDTYLKSPYYRPWGTEQGLYRVGPLARLQVARQISTPQAEAERKEFVQRTQSQPHSSFYYHYARLIEMLYALESLEQLSAHPDALNAKVRAQARPNRQEGIGVAEAPRGTLIHHYRTDENGLVQWANLVIATGHNSLAINRGLLQVAQRFVQGDRLEQGMLNRVEAVVRAFDPCLSCATHAWGQMPLQLSLYGVSGELLDQLSR